MSFLVKKFCTEYKTEQIVAEQDKLSEQKFIIYRMKLNRNDILYSWMVRNWRALHPVLHPVKQIWNIWKMHTLINPVQIMPFDFHTPLKLHGIQPRVHQCNFLQMNDFVSQVLCVIVYAIQHLVAGRNKSAVDIFFV